MWILKELSLSSWSKPVHRKSDKLSTRSAPSCFNTSIALCDLRFVWFPDVASSDTSLFPTSPTRWGIWKSTYNDIVRVAGGTVREKTRSNERLVVGNALHTVACDEKKVYITVRCLLSQPGLCNDSESESCICKIWRVWRNEWYGTYVLGSNCRKAKKEKWDKMRRHWLETANHFEICRSIRMKVDDINTTDF